MSRRQIQAMIFSRAFKLVGYFIYLRNQLIAAKRESMMRASVKEGFKPGGVPFPAGGGKFISEEGPERIVCSFPLHPDSENNYQELKESMMPTHIKFGYSEHYHEEIIRGKAHILFAEQIDRAKRDLIPINHFLKSVNKPELPPIINFKHEQGGESKMLIKHINGCISTDCCGKCREDKPE